MCGPYPLSIISIIHHIHFPLQQNCNLHSLSLFSRALAAAIYSALKISASTAPLLASISSPRLLPTWFSEMPRPTARRYFGGRSSRSKYGQWNISRGAARFSSSSSSLTCSFPPRPHVHRPAFSNYFSSLVLPHLRFPATPGIPSFSRRKEWGTRGSPAGYESEAFRQVELYRLGSWLLVAISSLSTFSRQQLATARRHGNKRDYAGRAERLYYFLFSILAFYYFYALSIFFWLLRALGKQIFGNFVGLPQTVGFKHPETVVNFLLLNEIEIF